MSDTVIILSYHGTVESPDELPGFLKNIRRGRPAPEEVVEEVRHRMELIGGSPLRRTAEAQAAALEERLGVPVRAAARLWHPYPSDVLAPFLESGVKKVVSVPLAPQSVHIYHPDVEKVVEGRDIELRCAEPWGQSEALVSAFVEAIGEAAARFESPSVQERAVILTAHSLPIRVIRAGDPYEKDFRVMANTVAQRLGDVGMGSVKTCIAFQSEGMGGGDWLGPRLAEEMKRLRSEGVDDVLIAPIGFVADHIETLYDLDVEAAQWASEMGFRQMERMPGMDVRPAFIDALEAVARPLL